MNKALLLISGVFLLPGILCAQLSADITDSTNLSCFGSMDGSATVSVSGGTEPYEILWDDDSVTTELTATSLSAGRWYRVRVTDAAMEEAMDSVMLEQPEEISVGLFISKSIECYGPSEGYIKLSSSGGKGPHTYLWNGSPSGDSIYGLGSGKHYYSVTDSTACAILDSLILEEASMVQINIDSLKQNPCLGQEKGAVYISASGGQGPYTYLWTGPSGLTRTTEDITGLAEGGYSLDLTDARGCVYQRDTSLVDGDPISVNYSVSQFRDFNLICYGDASGSIAIDTVIGNGEDLDSYTYIWSGPNSFRAYTHEISNLRAGNYHLNVTDPDGCHSYVLVTLLEPPAVGIVYDSVVTNPCIDDRTSAIYLSINNGVDPFVYEWTGPGDFSSDSEDIANLAKGRYTVTVTDADGCSSNSEKTLEQVDEIEIVLAISSAGDYNVSCYGSDDGFIKILSIPGYENLSGFKFLTTGPGGFTSPLRFMTSGIRAGAYHIQAIDPLGCSGETDTTLTEPPAVVTDSISGATEFIYDTNYTYEVTGADASSTYTWSVTGGEIWTGQGTGMVEIEWRASSSGTVMVYETDLNDCMGDTVSLATRLFEETPDTTGTAIEDLANSIRVYPNPVASSIFIEGLNNVNYDVEVYNLLGRLIMRLGPVQEADLSCLERGVYYLRVNGPSDGAILTRKILKK